VPIWLLSIADEHRRKVDRYLDATRSAMLFGPRVLLVEGMAEVLLLPSIARRVLTNPDEQARFRATSLVGIDGVDFEPYVRILLTPHDSIRVADRVVVVTDADPAAPGDRVAALTELGAELGAGNSLVVKASVITLEASLMQAGNAECIRDAFLAQRPQSQHVWEQDVLAHATDNQPSGLVAMLKDKRVLKGDMAQFIAAYIDDKAANEFTTPAYLEEAVQAVVAP
jgi:putative ATP-dependent endonuclease of OLD family